MKKHTVKLIGLFIFIIVCTSAYTISYMKMRRTEIDFDRIVIYKEGGNGSFFELFYKPAMFVDEMISGRAVEIRD